MFHHLGSISVSAEGKATFTTDLPFGANYIKEVATHEGYILSDMEYDIVFDYAGQDISSVTIEANDGTAIHNELIRGDIHDIKVGENDEPLENAEIGLFAMNGDTPILCVLMSIFVKYDGNFADDSCEVDFCNAPSHAITEVVRVGNAEFVLGENTKTPNSFVTWQCRDGDDYFFGHYFNSRLSAQKDLYCRAVEEIKFLETLKKQHREER